MKPVDDRISLILRKIHDYLYYLCLFHAHPDSRAATRTRPDSYSLRAFVSSHSRKLANAQTERSVAATSTVLVTESELSSTYQHWESLYQVQWFHKITVCNHCTWWSNYYHTIYIQLAHLCKELDDGKNYTCTTWECFTWNICKSNTSYYKYNYIIPANLGV